VGVLVVDVGSAVGLLVVVDVGSAVGVFVVGDFVGSFVGSFVEISIIAVGSPVGMSIIGAGFGHGAHPLQLVHVHLMAQESVFQLHHPGQNRVGFRVGCRVGFFVGLVVG